MDISNYNKEELNALLQGYDYEINKEKWDNNESNLNNISQVLKNPNTQIREIRNKALQNLQQQAINALNIQFKIFSMFSRY